MRAVVRWQDEPTDPVEVAPPPAGRVDAHALHRPMPAAISAAVWRGTELASTVASVVSSGFPALDAELPSGGWPAHAITELLQAQPSVAEWRLLAPTMRQVVAKRLDIVVIGPPKSPHLPGLQQVGIDERRLVWLRAETPAERLWVTDQLVKTNSAGMVVAWLPQARQEQIRRLQIAAHAFEGPVFLCRPAAAEHEASAAPLRVQVRFGLDWELHLHILKRKGPTHEGWLTLPSVPGGLESILTPRLRRPSALIAARGASTEAVEVPHALGSTPSRRPVTRPVATH